MSAPSDFRLTTSSERFDPDDERVTRAERELWKELLTETNEARIEETSVPHAKGFTETLILSLASSGSITIAIQCLRGWLSRDASRVIELTRTVDDVEEKIVLRGTGVSDESLAQFAALLGTRSAK